MERAREGSGDERSIAVNENPFMKGIMEAQKKALETAVRKNPSLLNASVSNMPFSFRSARHGNYEFELKRINVFLGANGCGKSTLLNEIKQAVMTQQAHKVIYIEGGRALQVVDSLEVDQQSFKQFEKLDAAITNYENKRAQNLSGRIKDALIVLDRQDQAIKVRHSDQVDAWLKGDRKDECPVRPYPPLERLFDIFKEIFPEIELSFNGGDKRLWASKGGSKYGPSKLSDGEKQVFSILADFMEVKDAFRFVVIDEPELNLHPELANKLWSRIEAEFPDKIFFYATHSISFALRSNVETVYVLGSAVEKIARFEGLSLLDRVDVSAFLGELPGILSTDKLIVVEGDEKSFDVDFYKWLTQESRLAVFPAGSCLEVASIIAKQGLWAGVASSIKMLGVVDRDYRGDEYIAKLESDGLIALPLHEVESYLCIPEVVVALADQLGVHETPLTVEMVEKEIFLHLRQNILSIAARRFFARSKFDFGPSVSRASIASASDVGELADMIVAGIDRDLDSVLIYKDKGRVCSEIESELAMLEGALQRADTYAALRFAGGKELLGRLCRLAGFRRPEEMLRTLRKKFTPDQFRDIRAFRELIESRLA